MSSPPPPGPEWPSLVRHALQPRLVRLSLLSLFAVHASLTAVHLPRALSSGSLLTLLLLPLRPTLLLCSLAAFTAGILPLLVVRRRILTRAAFHQQFVSVSPGGAPTPLAAALDGLTSLGFTLALAASLAAYSPDPAWWAPYTLVPSTRTARASKAQFGRTIATTNEFWRPNEFVWVLLGVGLVWGVAASIAASLSATPAWRARTGWPLPPQRTPPFPLSLVHSISASSSSPAATLPARIGSTLPSLLLSSALAGALLSTALLTLYLPLRLPLFRLLLALLPPYSALRRLVIPSLRKGYGLTWTRVAALYALSGLTAALNAALRALAVGLWEVYATHPSSMASASPKPTEALLAAIEAYSPRAPASADTSVAPQERPFLFTHALFDLAALATDTSPQGSERRRAFFKHFGVPSRASPLVAHADSATAKVTVSAWERLSAALLPVVKAAREEIRAGGGATPQAAGSAPPAPAHGTQGVKPPQTPIPIKQGGTVGSGAGSSTAVATSTSTSAPPASGSGSSAPQPQTVWQRLVPQPPPAPSQPPSSSSAPAPAPAPAAAPSPTTPPLLPKAAQDFLAPLLSRLPPLSSLPISLPFLGTGPSTTAGTERGQCANPLDLLLTLHATLRLLQLSLSEDEWGSVTLSERGRGSPLPGVATAGQGSGGAGGEGGGSLGVERWCSEVESLVHVLEEKGEQGLEWEMVREEGREGVRVTRGEFGVGRYACTGR